jgi:hypothetical protein
MVSTEKIGQKSVIIVNCENMKSDQTQEIIMTLQQASALVAKQSEKSVYIITIVTNVKFNSDISSAFKQYASANTDYVKESILVGLSGLQTVVFSAIKALTKRDYHLAATLDEAKKLMETL